MITIKKAMTAIEVAFVSFALSYGYWINSNQVGEYISLTLFKPFVYRQLMPMLARSLTWLGVPANWAIVLVMTSAGVAFYYALRALTLHFYPFSNGEQLDLWVFALFVVGLSLFWFERLPSDWATAFLFTLAFLFLAQGKMLAYILLYPIVCLNRETAFLLTVFFLFYVHKVYVPLDVAIFIYQVVVWFAVRISLMIIFLHNGGLNAWISPLQNFQKFIAHPWHSLLHIVITVIILYLVLKGWKRKPLFLRTAFVVMAPLLLIMYWILGQPFEVRVFWEVYPAAALLMLPTLQNGLVTKRTDS